VDPSLRKVFELGNILHDFIVDVIKSEKTPEVKLLKTELPFKMEIEDFVISGRVDNLMLLKANNTKYLVEVKSTRSIRGIKRALPHHVVQIQFYMHATNIHDGILLYVDKSTMETKTFHIKYSEEQTKKIVDKFKSLHKHLTKETLPVDEAKRNADTKWMCKYCEYKLKCDKKEK
jgi:CRISPR/Cas system-associated exonuclease Cas4 (RecB family)